MREPLRLKTRPAGQVSTFQSVPPPVGGWNARDAWADMAPTDAIALENFFPTTSSVDSRGGYSSFATGMTGNGKTLATYNKLTGTSEMYCYTASGIYDVSSAGAVGASKLARTNGKHQWVNFGDGTNVYLMAFNGVDKPAFYDGTTWTAVDSGTSPALTGVTTTNLIAPNVFKGRLFVIEKNKLSFWYLPAGAAGGALVEFSLQGEARRGGYLVAMATWTVDAGDGPDDRAVFMTSEGELIVYVGNNPSSASAWAKVGSYFIGRPIGRRCFCKLGGDLAVVTEAGVFPMSAAIQSAVVDYKEALSDKIRNAFTDASRNYFSIFGWVPIVYPNRSALIVNVPHAEDGVHEQFVMNTITKAWCKFTGWNAEDMVIYGGDLYFTSGTVVYKAWTGAADGTSDIVLYGKTAFTNLGHAGELKNIKLYRPVLSVNGSLSFLTDIDVDFSDTALVGIATSATVSGAIWNTSKWGTGLWASSTVIQKDWTSPQNYPGIWIAGKLKISTQVLTIKWMANDYIYESGVGLK